MQQTSVPSDLRADTKGCWTTWKQKKSVPASCKALENKGATEEVQGALLKLLVQLAGLGLHVQAQLHQLVQELQTLTLTQHHNEG